MTHPDPWIEREIAHVRKTTHMTGPGRLMFELVAVAYLDAAHPPQREKRLASSPDPAGWLERDGRALYERMRGRTET